MSYYTVIKTQCCEESIAFELYDSIEKAKERIDELIQYLEKESCSNFKYDKEEITNDCLNEKGIIYYDCEPVYFEIQKVELNQKRIFSDVYEKRIYID